MISVDNDVNSAQTDDGAGAVVIYFDYDGTAHDDDVRFNMRTREITMGTPGRTLFEWLPILERILVDFPAVKIVLATSWVRYLGFEYAKSQLTKGLQDRVVGSTFTKRYAQKKWFDSMSRGEQIVKDVLRRKPVAWIAIDNDGVRWPKDFTKNLVLTDPSKGISSSDIQALIVIKLQEIYRTPNMPLSA